MVFKINNVGSTPVTRGSYSLKGRIIYCECVDIGSSRLRVNWRMAEWLMRSFAKGILRNMGSNPISPMASLA